MCVYLSVGQSVCLSVYVSVSLPVCLSIYVPVCQSIRLVCLLVLICGTLVLLDDLIKVLPISLDHLPCVEFLDAGLRILDEEFSDSGPGSNKSAGKSRLGALLGIGLLDSPDKVGVTVETWTWPEPWP